MFYGGNVVRVLVHFFSQPLNFTLHWWPLAFPILSPPLQNFPVALSTKNVSSIFYLSLLTSVALFLVELRWPAAYFLFFSVFLLLYIPMGWVDYFILLPMVLRYKYIEIGLSLETLVYFFMYLICIYLLFSWFVS